MSEKLLCFESKSDQTNLLWPYSYYNKSPQHFITAGKTILASNNPVRIDNYYQGASLLRKWNL